MNPLHAVVKKGRLTLDEPTELPDGQVVVLLPLEELLAMTGEDDGAGEPVMMLSLPSSRAPSFRRTKPVDAAAILDELRSL